MKWNHIVFGSIICLIWWLHEILSSPINEKNGTEIVMMPFTINANPLSIENTTIKTLIKLSTTPKPSPIPKVTENSVKVSSTQETKLVIPTITIFPKNHRPSFQPHTEPGNVEVIKGKYQKWQIPSPIQATTPQPREIENNSSKETDVEAKFIPSLQVGSFDNTEGFVPKVHQPKTLNFLQSFHKPSKFEEVFNVYKPVHEYSTTKPSVDILGLHPPLRDHGLFSSKNFYSDSKEFDPSKAISKILNVKSNSKVRFTNIGSNKKVTNRRQGMMEQFQKDFHKLVDKYPELGELIQGYPIMEEIMKQKLADKFEKNSYNQHHYSVTDYEEEEGDSEEDENDSSEENHPLKFNTNQGLPFKFTNYKFQSDEEANVNIYKDNPQTFDGAPYPYDGKKPSWGYKKKPDDISSIIPAGGYYQSSKFPIDNDHKTDKKPIEEENPLNIDIYDKPPQVSPWKRAFHMLTAFLPVGLLISALTPNVININNTADQSYPIRQRSTDANNPVSKLSNPLLAKLETKFYDLENIKLLKQLSDNPACDDWNFCELAKKGESPSASGMEKIFWQLAHEVPEHIAEKNGMKKLFKAIKSRDCNQFYCKANFKPNTVNENDENKKEKSEFDLGLEDDIDENDDEDEDNEKSVVKKDEPGKITII